METCCCCPLKVHLTILTFLVFYSIAEHKVVLFEWLQQFTLILCYSTYNRALDSHLQHCNSNLQTFTGNYVANQMLEQNVYLQLGSGIWFTVLWYIFTVSYWYPIYSNFLAIKLPIKYCNNVVYSELLFIYGTIIYLL